VGLGVINGNFSHENLDVVQNFCNYLEIELVFKQFTFDLPVQLDGRIAREGYIRLLWMDELEEQFLWMDSVTLPLPGWDQIFSFLGPEENGPTIAVIADRKIIEKRNKFPENLADQRAADAYFNSGVFLVNPLNWRAKGYDHVWKEVRANFKELGFMHHDQDILNYVLSNDKRIIPGKFNVIVSHPTQIEQNILHFAGGPRPWHLAQNSARYDSTIESIQNFTSQNGAFSGKNWLFEFENYWRHEDFLISFVGNDAELCAHCSLLRTQSRREMMNRVDHIKFSPLKLIGKNGFCYL
jgi:lipopolysaccharide biosynthesis glycosyltransferase